MADARDTPILGNHVAGLDPAAAPMGRGEPGRPRAEGLFRPVHDRRGLRLAIVLGNQAPAGVCPYAAGGRCHHCDIGLG